MLSAAVAAVFVSLPNSRAAFSDTTDSAGNSFHAAASWTTVQSGTASISSNGGTNTLTLSIASVDPSKSFLVFQSRHDGNRPVNSMLRGRIASATSLEFVRVSNEAPLGYSYRQMLTINVGANTPSGGYNGYTVRITGIDTQSLVSTGKLRADGNDLGVFYWNGSSWIEVDREVRNLNTTDTHIIFKSQTDIPASGSDSDHYLFYGNPGAAAPNPLDTTNVYIWYDDASQDRLSQYTQGRGDNWIGTGWADSFAWNVAGYYTYDTGGQLHRFAAAPGQRT